jgi:hypothetical protein
MHEQPVYYGVRTTAHSALIIRSRLTSSNMHQSHQEQANDDKKARLHLAATQCWQHCKPVRGTGAKAQWCQARLLNSSAAHGQ